MVGSRSIHQPFLESVSTLDSIMGSMESPDERITMGDAPRGILDPPGLNLVMSFGSTGSADPLQAERSVQACNPKELH